ncbi:hypothetical protein BDV96DRAFT_641377 [Lophiotrema nucula]|uniref:Uncharacterized protein n=1 Tax=Lophiotrema nucula TaxID=690887 RepID=A0A6A5ZR38_9PLEO|nr:hypothetical protein BDV96DRAFT_641377 [Lophiotrema nucula]
MNLVAQRRALLSDWAAESSTRQEDPNKIIKDFLGKEQIDMKVPALYNIVNNNVITNQLWENLLVSGLKKKPDWEKENWKAFKLIQQLLPHLDTQYVKSDLRRYPKLLAEFRTTMENESGFTDSNFKYNTQQMLNFFKQTYFKLRKKYLGDDHFKHPIIWESGNGTQIQDRGDEEDLDVGKMERKDEMSDVEDDQAALEEEVMDEYDDIVM